MCHAAKAAKYLTVEFRQNNSQRIGWRDVSVETYQRVKEIIFTETRFSEVFHSFISANKVAEVM